MEALLWLAFVFGLLPLVRGQNTLETCLTSTPNLTAIMPSDETYHNLSQPFNLRIAASPAAILYPTSPDQVSQILACAVSSGMNVSTRSGGHSYAAYGLSGNVVIDLSKLKSLTVDGTGKAISQTGLLLGELALGLWNQGERALPHGSCPYVGTGGHALYGGFGFYSRAAGLLMDRIVSADVILANGSAVTASNASNPDLFWALRGAGPSFGIVTAWTFDTLPAPKTTVYYQITFDSPLSANEITSAFISWQQFATTAPKELAMSAVFGPTGDGGIFLIFEGSYYGASEQFNAVIGPLLPNLPANRRLNGTALGWVEGLEASDGNLNTSQPGKPNTFFAKSLVTTQPSTNDSVASLMRYLFGPGLSTDVSWFAQVDLYGGEIASVPADATAFAHRDAFLVYQLYASSLSTLPPYPVDGVSFVNGMLTALDANPKAAYPNYIDPTLTSEQWQLLYFADHMARLEQIKRDYDPNNVFNFQQAIPPAAIFSGAGGTAPPGAAPSHQPSAATSSTGARWLVVILSLFSFSWII